MTVSHLAPRLRWALHDLSDEGVCGLRTACPADARDGLLALLLIHALHLAPLGDAPGGARWQHHPAVADLKGRLERQLLTWLAREEAAADWPDTTDAVDALRAVATMDRVPVVYEWMAEQANWEELVGFLALEGGPDDGFDDLVAACQVGLDGRAKLEMARNYWDEMGNGDARSVHRALHQRFARSVALPRIPLLLQPLDGLRRMALNGLLATNRYLQPELIGALGLIELQAGPRCRKVVAAMHRLGASPDARAFYEEHAEADPRHGKAWLDEVVGTLAADPLVAAGIVRGAHWRSVVNRRFFRVLADTYLPVNGHEAAAS